MEYSHPNINWFKLSTYKKNYSSRYKVIEFIYDKRQKNKNR